MIYDLGFEICNSLFNLVLLLIIIELFAELNPKQILLIN
ncbi:hypothetical protein S225a_19870 [Candidatus Brocadiaceae bacterium S225]|uniref:Uncharacterized protein n=1 Tax=Candidatus Scalindua brodae TaxID=237368 RepID=A0A0B0EM05_9BACT|nr:MAG: hypothetical protein SCABRO_02523 [Candidatus Scalindua brodae]TWU31904.1 hypothetical protein S225a_19870 [Candidatus Brocadiaceae bacterium S225]